MSPLSEPGRALSRQDIAALRAHAENDPQHVLSGAWDKMAAQYEANAVRMPPHGPAIRGRDAIRRSLVGMPPIADFTFDMIEPRPPPRRSGDPFRGKLACSWRRSPPASRRLQPARSGCAQWSVPRAVSPVQPSRWRQVGRMQSSDILQTIAEVAVALTGFSGVVVVLGSRGAGSWSKEDLLQLRTLVEPSLLALFGSFLPGTVQLAVPSEPFAWRISTGALGLLGVAALVAFVRRSRIAGTTFGQRVLTVVSIIGLGALFLASAGVVSQYELVFVLGLILALIVAAYNFLLLLFSFGRAA